MRCKYCNEKLAPHDLWCVKCGKRSEILSDELSAVKSLKNTWNLYNPVKGNNLPVGILATVTGVIPMIVLIWILNYALPGMLLWQFILLHSVVWTLFLPLMIIPFKQVCRTDDYKINVSGFFNSFRAYPAFMLFSLISVLFYVIIFYLCKGDPILNLVWLVLVLYWIAIAIPVPVLMVRYNINAWKAVKLSYKYAGDVRWNIFLMVIILFVINIIAAGLLVIGLSVTVPFTWYAIRDYVNRMIEYEVL
jgi:hypothetical protein